MRPDGHASTRVGAAPSARAVRAPTPRRAEEGRRHGAHGAAPELARAVLAHLLRQHLQALDALDLRESFSNRSISLGPPSTRVEEAPSKTSARPAACIIVLAVSSGAMTKRQLAAAADAHTVCSATGTPEPSSTARTPAFAAVSPKRLSGPWKSARPMPE